MLSPNRNARLLGRLALAASTLAFAGTEIQVEAADPSSTTSSAPTWNGQEMLVAGTGFRGSNFTSLFNKKRRLPKENGEDFVDPDFKDFVGPAGRVSEAAQPAVTQTPARSTVPAAANSATTPPPLSPVDEPIVAESSAPPAVPPAAIPGEEPVVEAAPALTLPSFPLTLPDNYDLVELDSEELFPADVTTKQVEVKVKPKNFADALFGEKTEIRTTTSVATLENDNEVWPEDLYPAVPAGIDEGIGLMVDDELLADNEPVPSDASLPPVDGPSQIETASATEPATSGDSDFLLPPLPGEDLADDSLAAATPPATTGSASEYWQPSPQGPTAEAWQSRSIEQESGWQGRSVEPEGVASTKSFNGWQARDTQPTEIAPASLPQTAELGGTTDEGETLLADAGTPDLAPPALDMTEETTDLDEQLSHREGLTGLKGFCPVTLCEHRDLVDADPRFAAVYNDRTYYLCSYEALIQFQENPVKYAPVIGGNDIVALERDGVEIEGILDHAAWYRGKLYLFATADLLAEFSANPREYAID